jgi:hypothetical protein
MRKHEKPSILSTIKLYLIVGLLAKLFPYPSIIQFADIMNGAAILGQLRGVVFVFDQGTLIKNKPFLLLILAFLGLTFMGAVWKIMHYNFADIMLLTGLIGVPTIYAMHFFKKQDKQRLDILKLAWVIASCMAALFAFQHLSLRYELQVIEKLLFLIMFANFTYKQDWTDEQGATMK